MTGPTRQFFIVGAQRCGTTYLRSLVDEHPEIEMAMPLRPEPKFFLRDSLADTTIQQYESSHFGRKPGARVHGEKSTSYMESRQAAQGIANWFPDAGIVFLLRNPVERAVSHYWFSVGNGLEALPMSEAFAREDERRLDFDPAKVSVSPYAYLSRGRYVDAIEMYLEFFPREQVAVVFFEELVAGPGPVRNLFRFLGVDDRFSPQAAGRRINEGDYEHAALTAGLASLVNGYYTEPNARLAALLGRRTPAQWDATPPVAGQ